MRAGLSSNLPSSMFISGPVLTLLLDRAEKSLMHFQPAICVGSCGGGDPLNLSTISRMCDLKGNWTVGQIRSLREADFLIRDSGSEW
jgi:hypothetical protein